MAGQLVNPVISDGELRAMRDAVYPASSPASVQSDESWEHVKHNWRRDEEWLKAEAEKIRTMRWNSKKVE